MIEERILFKQFFPKEILDTNRSDNSPEIMSYDNMISACSEVTSQENGFFWLKPSCSKTNLLIYCDFSFKNPKGFYHQEIRSLAITSYYLEKGNPIDFPKFFEYYFSICLKNSI